MKWPDIAERVAEVVVNEADFDIVLSGKFFGGGSLTTATGSIHMSTKGRKR